jgi:trigger factor
MKYEFKKLPHSKIELSVFVASKELEPLLNQAVKKAIETTEVPGFRRGRAPKELVLQRLGELAIYQSAAGIAVKTFFSKIAEENYWEPIGKPEVTITKLVPNNPLEFKIEFAVMPEVELPGNYKELLKKLKKERKQVKVSEEDINQTISWLQHSRSSFSEVFRPAREKDWLTIDLLIKENNDLVEKGKQEDLRFCLKESSLIPGFAKEFIGQQRGRIKFSLRAPEDYWQKNLAGKNLDFEVLIKKVEQETLPELNDEFARSVGKFNSFEEFRESLADGLKKEAEEKETQRFRLVLLKHLSDLVKLDLPEVLFEREKENMVEELRSSVTHPGLIWEDYLSEIKKTEEELKKEFESGAKERINYPLLLEAVARKESVEPAIEEVEQETNKILQQFKDVKRAENSIDVYQLITYTKGKLRNEKTAQLLEQIALS